MPTVGLVVMGSDVVSSLNEKRKTHDWNFITKFNLINIQPVSLAYFCSFYNRIWISLKCKWSNVSNEVNLDAFNHCLRHYPTGWNIHSAIHWTPDDGDIEIESIQSLHWWIPCTKNGRLLFLEIHTWGLHSWRRRGK